MCDFAHGKLIVWGNTFILRLVQCGNEQCGHSGNWYTALSDRYHPFERWLQDFIDDAICPCWGA